jgi:hypothetical protein
MMICQLQCKTHKCSAARSATQHAAAIGLFPLQSTQPSCLLTRVIRV